ncbi:hypothetical protein AOLI_G00057030 [Acnodon oligacanthus]
MAAGVQSESRSRFPENPDSGISGRGLSEYGRIKPERVVFELKPANFQLAPETLITAGSIAFVGHGCHLKDFHSALSFQKS